MYSGTDQQKPKKADSQLYWPERTFWCHHWKTGASIFLAASSHTPEGAWQYHRDLCPTGTAVLIPLNIRGEVLIDLTPAVFTRSVLSSLTSVRKKISWLTCISPFPFFQKAALLVRWHTAVPFQHLLVIHCSQVPLRNTYTNAGSLGNKQEDLERKAGPSLPLCTESKYVRRAKKGK